MKVKISIEQEFDLDSDLEFMDDDPYFEENKDSYDLDTRIDLLVNRFCEDIDYAVKYDEVRDSVRVEYIEE